MRDPARTWEELQTRLAGSFTAHPRGFPGMEISLLGPAGEFGRIRPRGPSGAEVAAGTLNATIEQTGNARYRMIADGASTLTAGPEDRSADVLEITAGGRTCKARASFFRNRAQIRSPEGEEVARIEGNLTGGRYTAAFDPGTEGALPAAILLLYHLIIHRKRAFRAG